ncbi:hypothetical protein KQ939_02810 [Planococcus sp. CP5-4]|uniref:hypothetical protein n=1 Tax=unclassified Planococcus (in: firmicutes) TaxID=2662419 RepID=UPI001C22023E|nr:MULTISPECIES: hypothetical protein [unclassified Planococcus (in: firmicutes)]MBU9674963.1 hypothetical protein [Planococcus sp. CP5-4_YE]MBV0908426.1 hypothetical protein [Planococcus sp. CP5-4_UN]MBW6062640.1 hypothetical protein [Planococcus sp. CP5-4]
MIRKNEFVNWLELNTSLSPNSISKYAGAINTISKELNDEGKLQGSLYSIVDSFEVEKTYRTYFAIPCFIDKNHRGNNMYSNALKHYIAFTKDKF